MATAVTIPLEPVNSSRLAAIGFDEETFTLAVRFPPTKNAPAGKVYHYQNISEEIFDDLKRAESVGTFFNENILKNPDKYPFACVDDGTGQSVDEWVAQKSTPEWNAKQAEALTIQADPEVLSPQMPDDPDGLKSRALTTRTEATAITISSADECEAASLEVMRIRAERKIAIEKINKIKEPATQAWKAACALFNEVDGRYAEAEKFLDDGILAYRAEARRKAAEEQAARDRAEREAREKAEREQREEYDRRQRAAEAEAAQRAAELAEQDAKAAEAQGAPLEVVQQIRDNPLPVTIQPVAPPPLAYTPAPLPSLTPLEIPKVQGLSYTTEWFYNITDEKLIPLTHDFYTLDPKKINAKVQSLKQHANIPGVKVDSREVPIKRTAKR